MEILLITIDDYCAEILVKVETSIFGIRLWSRQREFIKCHGDEEWMEFGNRKTVSEKTTRVLNDCLDNHIKNIQNETKENFDHRTCTTW